MTKHNFNQLKNYFANYNSANIAFSGGVDSSLLASAAFAALKNFSEAITVVTEFTAKRDLEFAVKSAKQIGIRHRIINLSVFNAKQIVNNDALRCYYCKKLIIKGINTHPLFEGSHIDDSPERPGLKAINEEGVISPYIKLDFAKNDIIEMARFKNLIAADRPSNSCLATRISDSRITIEKLETVEKIEEKLFSLNVNWCRAKINNDQIRIEYGRTAPINEENLKNYIYEKITLKPQNIGFKFYPSK